MCVGKMPSRVDFVVLLVVPVGLSVQGAMSACSCFACSIDVPWEVETVWCVDMAIALNQGRYLPAMPKAARNDLRKLRLCTLMLESTGIGHTSAIMMVASR